MQTTLVRKFLNVGSSSSSGSLLGGFLLLNFASVLQVSVSNLLRDFKILRVGLGVSLEVCGCFAGLLCDSVK